MAAAAQSITKPADRGVNPALSDYPGTRAIDSDRSRNGVRLFTREGDLSHLCEDYGCARLVTTF